MPIWFELIVLALAAYALGLGFGWLAWGDVTGTRHLADGEPDTAEESPETP